MAIPTSNISIGTYTTSSGVCAVLWDNLIQTNTYRTMYYLHMTQNNTASNKNMYAFAGDTQGVSPAYSGNYDMRAVAQSGTQVMNITATCAWMVLNDEIGDVTCTNSTGQVTLQGSGGAGTVHGGNGTITLTKWVSSGSGEIQMVWSNGAGSRQTQRVGVIM